MTYNTTDFLATARNIGMELVRDAIWDNDRCTWMGASMEPVDGKFVNTVRSFGADLYSGTSGIALFLSALYTVEKDALLLRTLEGAINHALSGREKAPDNGFYAGKAGIAYSLIECGKRTGREDWTRHGIALLQSIEPKANHPYETDLISGIAGTIPGLLYGYAHTNDTELLDKAVKLGDVLCDMAEKSTYGWAWKSIPGKPVLTGISHGIAGIAGSLLELYKVTKKAHFNDAAMEGIKYEQLFFSPAQSNWPDLREGLPATTDKYVFGVAWCHGAPGMAISRAHCAEILGDAALTEHAGHALKTTYNQTVYEVSTNGNLSNFSICHGLAGNADILLDSGNPQYMNAAVSAGVLGIEKYATPRLPWPSGVLSKQKTPGLMMGIAGTGYFYLRLYDQSFKSILLPPKY